MKEKEFKLIINPTIFDSFIFNKDTIFNEEEYNDWLECIIKNVKELYKIKEVNNSNLKYSLDSLLKILENSKICIASEFVDDILDEDSDKMIIDSRELVKTFEDMAKRETLLTGSNITQEDLLIQIIGTIAHTYLNTHK